MPPIVSQQAQLDHWYISTSFPRRLELARLWGRWLARQDFPILRIERNKEPFSFTTRSEKCTSQRERRRAPCGARRHTQASNSMPLNLKLQTISSIWIQIWGSTSSRTPVSPTPSCRKISLVFVILKRWSWYLSAFLKASDVVLEVQWAQFDPYVTRPNWLTWDIW